MIDDKFNLTVKVGKKKRELFFNMLTIKNLYKLTGISVFEWIDNFFKAENKEEYVTQLLLAMFNGYIDTKLLNELVENKDIVKSLMMIINAEMSSEKIKYKEIENKNNSSEIDLKSNENFEVWYNNLFYYSTIEFNKNSKWFYRATPRQINSLSMLLNNNRKDILISAYCDINAAKNEAYEKKNTVELDEYTSLGDAMRRRIREQ